MHDAIFKDLKELNEQSKAYQYSCINAQDAYSKLLRAREKALKANQKQKPKLEKKEKEVWFVTCTLVWLCVSTLFWLVNK